MGKRFLFFTNAEHGQANVVLATASELLLRGMDVHIASYGAAGALTGSSLQARVEALHHELDAADGGTVPPARFHAMRGRAVLEAWLEDHKDVNILLTPGFRAAWHSCAVLPLMIAPWTPAEYLDGVASCVEILERVRPDLVVVEKTCAQAVDACRSTGRTFVYISPNSFKETIAAIQPWGFGLWGVPVFLSGNPLPVPWHLRPLNLLLSLRLLLALLLAPNLRALARARSAAHLHGPYPVLDPAPTIPHLLPATPETDFPFPYYPPNVHPCGPITLPSPPLAHRDPHLAAWLRAAPTVLVNLGSNFVTDAGNAGNIARAIAGLLDADPRLQVLWKRKLADGVCAEDVDAVLEAHRAAERVRVVGWMEAEPGEVVRSGAVVCSVHHGGANTYFEAVSAGVPQIILPCWLDTHDYAARVELLGIGLHGSRATVPRVGDEGLARAMREVTGTGERGRGVRERARALAERMKRYGGRVAAAERLVEMVEGGRGERE